MIKAAKTSETIHQIDTLKIVNLVLDICLLKIQNLGLDVPHIKDFFSEKNKIENVSIFISLFCRQIANSFHLIFPVYGAAEWWQKNSQLMPQS